MKKAVVLLSGGLDSTVALFWALKKGFDCHALSFDYGQKHRKENAIAKKIASRVGVPFSCLTVRLPWSASSLTKKSKKIPHHSLRKIAEHHIPSTYVPGRNTIFLSFALSMADAIGASAIVIGANALDYSGYPDCRPRYLKAFERVANEGSKRATEEKKSIRILAPLLSLTKAGIVKLGRRLKAPLSMTWSCYEGGAVPCRQCDSCRLRQKGFADAGLDASDSQEKG